MNLNKSSVVFSLFAGLVLLSAAAQAAPIANTWYDLEKGDIGTLTQEILITGKRGESIVMKKGDLFLVNDVISLGGVSVMLYIFEQKNCQTPNAEADMVLVLPAEAPAKAEVGITFKKNCLVEIYAELKDVMKPGLFTIPATP